MAAGFWHLSSTMMFDQIARPAGGAEAWFYPADTLAQLVVYRDSGLTIPWTQPVQADGFGRMPNVYLDATAASFYRFRVTDTDGVELIALATIPILTPGSGGGGGGGVSVDATTILNTGDMWFAPIQGVRAGAVRCNGRTIGNALSGASERANADTQALFLYIWQNLSDTVAPVSGGRTTAAADFAANKRIGLPDLRGRAPFGLDGMGNSLAGVIPVAAIALNDTAGSPGGSSSHVNTTGEMVAHTHNVGTIVAATESAHTHGIGSYAAASESSHTHGVGTFAVGSESAHTHGVGTYAVGAHTHDTGTYTIANESSHTHGAGSYQVAPNGRNDLYSGGTALFAGANTPTNIGISATSVTGTSGAGSAHTHGFSGNSGSTAPGFSGTSGAGSSHTHSFTGTSAAGSSHTHTLSGTSAAGSAHTHTLSGDTASVGGGTSWIKLSPAFLGTWFIKL